MVTNTWEPDRDVLDTKTNSTLTGQAISAYDYTVNNVGQRTNVATSGTAAAAGRSDVPGTMPFIEAGNHSQQRRPKPVRVAAVRDMPETIYKLCKLRAETFDRRRPRQRAGPNTAPIFSARVAWPRLVSHHTLPSQAVAPAAAVQPSSGTKLA